MASFTSIIEKFTAWLRLLQEVRALSKMSNYKLDVIGGGRSYIRAAARRAVAASSDAS